MPQIARYLNRIDEYERTGNLPAARLACEALIQRDPNVPAAWLRWSMLAQRLDLYCIASDAARTAAAAVAASGRWEALSVVASRLLSFADLEHARSLILQADWSSREVLRQSPLLAQQLWLAGAYDDLFKLLDHVERIAPPHALLSYVRALGLRDTGRLSEATEAFEQSILARPTFSAAHWSLAAHAEDPSNTRALRVERLLAEVPPGSLDHIDLQFALFREKDRLGDVAAAWQALEQGAAMKRRLVPSYASRLQENVEVLANTSHRAVPTVAEAPQQLVPIFIVGMPRTGTTLLERILSGHDAVVSLGERNDFEASLCTEADCFLPGLDRGTPLARYSHVNLQAAGVRYLERVGQYTASREGCIIDKNPRNLFNVEFIIQALPHARILCLTKDGMDACFSNLKELFAADAYSYSYDMRELAEHYAQVMRLVKHWSRCYGSQFLALSYEQLVREPIATARLAAEFCGLQFKASSVAIQQNLSPVSTASSSQVRQPISTGFVGGWRRYADHLGPLRVALGNCERAESS